MSDFDAAGMQAARRYAQWHLGYRSWADQILNAYNNPEETNAALDEDQK